MERDIFSDEHDLFREQFRRFAEAELAPKVEKWNANGISDRESWRPRSTAARALTSSTTRSSWRSWRASALTA
jgi:hypothetical protein